MLKPTQMTKINLQVSEDCISRATIVIARLKSLHLLNVRKIPLGQNDFETNQENVLVNKYKKLNKRLQDLFESLGLEFEIPPCCSAMTDFDPYKDIVKLEKELQEKEGEINNIIEKIKLERESKREKQELLRLLEMIFSLNIDLSQFNNCKFLYLGVGLIPSENIDRLEFSLSSIYHILLPSTPLGKRRLCFVLASKKDEEKIEKAFKSAYFKKLDLSLIREGVDESRLKDLRGEIRDLKIDINLAEDYLEKLKKRAQKGLHEIHQKIYLSLIILDAARSFDKVGNNYHISGWVPNDFIPVLEKEIKKACPSQKVRISIPSSDSDLDEKSKKKGFVKIPTCLKNPFFLRPFEKLVFGYDIPDYHEVEPTLFFALGFLLMFGVMFGDVGHGLVLFLLGLFIAKKIKKPALVQVGFIAMECGVMSSIFGFLYGSVFGFEHILPALWFHPMQNIYYFMKVTIGFGIGFISLGLLLNIINSIKNREFVKGIFGELGIMGLVFYWGCVGLCVLYLVKGKFIISNAYLLWLLILPLVAIFLKEPIYNIYNRLVLRKKVKIWPSNPAIYFLESFIEIGDTIIGFLSNTVSFIRVSAFALAHAGLFLAVFALAQTLQNVKGGPFWYWLIVIIGNIGIIVVEGLVVSIQTIRLEYYEFFSKFFKGGGELYQPLKN
ncbi:MAG: V-type ATP synthase subunit I [bacterium]